MTSLATIARTLTDSLHLRQPPVAIAFTEALPAGVTPYTGLAPAGCDDGTRKFHVHANPNSDPDLPVGGDARLEQSALAMEPAFASRSSKDGCQWSGGFLG